MKIPSCICIRGRYLVFISVFDTRMTNPELVRPEITIDSLDLKGKDCPRQGNVMVSVVNACIMLCEER